MERQRELASLIDRYARTEGVNETAIPGLFLLRYSRLTEPMATIFEPMVCITAQGSKQMICGKTMLQYDGGHYFLATADAHAVGQVIEASPSFPYLCMSYRLDASKLAALALELDIKAAPDDEPGSSLSPGRVTPELMDAAIRLVALLGAPQDQAVLAPLAERELMYRLLTGETAASLLHIAMAENRLQQVNRAIGWIKRNYTRPFSIDVLAAEARMSVSALHKHFKAVTGASPLQYQKQLRLHEARRLIISGITDAATAGFTVGYESPSQFSREYRRLFGAPPLRDAARLRASSLPASLPAGAAEAPEGPPGPPPGSPEERGADPPQPFA
ncbi:AraC family transcriptional regulator [Arenibaculum pallidiluteum]|uniref:AraC family transcriptional regulator n=1 Tax=Arenibaculum pallidiluteum TaxID=2812559 RepID=UPI001A972404|nr:AraC family transcriptional regulator [Arenibaculum pallidiluteum]